MMTLVVLIRLFFAAYQAKVRQNEEVITTLTTKGKCQRAE